MTPSLSVGNAGNGSHASNGPAPSRASTSDTAVTTVAHTPNVSTVTTVTAVTGVTRWSIVVALMHSPDAEGRRLTALLERLPTERRRHECLDDCARRPGAGRRPPGVAPLEPPTRKPRASASFANCPLS